MSAEPQHLEVWTVYASPSDYPGKYIARCHLITETGTQATTAVMVAEDIDSLRDALSYAGLICVGREPWDDPVIVESWL